MKNLILILVLFLISYQCILSETILGGVLDEDMVLDSTGNPYIVTKNLLVKQGIKVIIKPGVIMKFNYNIYLQVDGELQALGEENNLITFTANNVKKWGGIKFTELASDYNDTLKCGAYFDYCFFEKADKCVKSEYASIKISNCIVNGDISFDWGATATIKHNIINGVFYIFEDPYKKRNGYAILDSNNFYGKENIIWTNSTITNNSFNNVECCLRIYSPKSIISNNIFSNSFIAVFVKGGDNYEITYNTFKNNYCHFIITCQRVYLIENNNFLDYGKYSLWWQEDKTITSGCLTPQGSGSYAEIDITNNYFGNLKTEEEIEESIFHFNDDFSVKGLFIFKPYL
jgi:hypothetical protein